MLKHYFITAWQQLLRGKRYSAITLGGLALGLAVSLTIAAYLRHELGFDRWIPQASRIGVVETTFALSADNTFTVPSAPEPAKAQFTAEIPAIEAATRFTRSSLTALKNGNPLALKMFQADASYFDVFALTFIAGQADTALNQPQAMVLTRSAATRLFGTVSVLGRVVNLESDKPHVVTAVIEDLPSATSFPFEALLPIPPGADTDPSANNWGMVSRNLFVKLAPGADFKQVGNLMGAVARPHVAKVFSALPDGGSAIRLTLLPLTEFHLHGANRAFGNSLVPHSLGSLVAFGLIGLLILVMAAFNTMNIALARSLERANEVALRKVVGATRRQIMVQFMGESMLVTLIALAFGLLLAGALQPWFAELAGLQRPLEVLVDSSAVGVVLSLVLLAGLMGGLYPALVASGYRPGRLVNQDVARRETGRLGRVLVVFQFAVAIALASSTLIIHQQVAFASAGARSFSAGNVLLVGGFPGLNTDPVRNEEIARITALETACRRLPSVTQTALTTLSPGSSGMMTVTMKPITGSDPISIERYAVGLEYFDVLRIAPLYGRVFDRGHRADAMHGGKEPRHGAVVLNITAARRLGFATPAEAVGKTLGEHGRYRVIGVIADVPLRSLHETVRPTAFIAGDEEVIASGSLTRLLIRLAPGAGAAANTAVEAQVKALFPESREPVAVRPLAQQIAAQYQHDKQQASALTAAALIALLIAVLGLYGLSALAAHRRTLEIGIRKVLGARLADLLSLLLWQSSRPVLLANLVAWAVAGYLMWNWLQGFALRISLNAWPFLTTGAAALFIALITVLGHAYAVARTHPALALREE